MAVKELSYKSLSELESFIESNMSEGMVCEEINGDKTFLWGSSQGDSAAYAGIYFGASSVYLMCKAANKATGFFGTSNTSAGVISTANRLARIITNDNAFGLQIFNENNYLLCGAVSGCVGNTYYAMGLAQNFQSLLTTNASEDLRLMYHKNGLNTVLIPIGDYFAGETEAFPNVYVTAAKPQLPPTVMWNGEDVYYLVGGYRGTSGTSDNANFECPSLYIKAGAE